MTLKHVFLASTLLTALVGGYAQAQQSSVSNQRTSQDQSEGQGTQIFVSSAGVRQIQQALTQKGYSTGNVDGRWNPQTASAARSFQQAQNMEPTGTLTIPLVYGLSLEQDIITGNTGAQGAAKAVIRRPSRLIISASLSSARIAAAPRSTSAQRASGRSSRP
ncbi:peptidoglycan-binding domain-containing protein [Methylobacterium gregans]|uniref:Peptidoglycan binding-like domain-containing protein n=1 Tax=Methylobacterium gregans TaxID=374424 RepID=A0AA37MF34_9HYPH|nr:peptidoglycan-binding domain-containing protein [Methylobacterium gregans]MDQ0524154.1 peptidoglycan hydrolase-like protein with peptidoglycan-binding domain [Methylobacterium gregans]GJD81123.1 hypothetical protein NBEOAGPD_4368 [Methylobacterium gregans]GLS54866.1 hypothetical protein GCM10007886_30500 [Methylobacterium gregans]